MPETPTKNEELLTLVQDPAAPIVVRLLKAPIADTVNAVTFADLVEADFDGYAAINDPGFDVIDEDDADFGSVLSENLTWTAGPNIVEQNIYGVVVTRHPTGNPVEIMDVYHFPQPILMQCPDQEISFRVRGFKIEMA